MDDKLTEKIRLWLDTPEDKRDYAQGAEYVLKLSNNMFLYRNIMANLKGKKDYVTYNLQKYYNFRVRSLTHAQVEEMQTKVEGIVAEHFSFEQNAPANEFKKGKRADHDELPDEIQAIYVENLSIVQKMREVHTRLRLLSTENSTCPDSERYPFLKELIDLDKKLHDNWYSYDHFDTGGNPAAMLDNDIREQSKAALRLINLNKNKYRNNPSEEFKARILNWYRQIINPSDKIRQELKDLNIL